MDFDNFNFAFQSVYVFLGQCAFTAWLLILANKNRQRLWKNKRLTKSLQNAKPFCKDSTEGDYVVFEGILKMPEVKTPFTNRACGFWATIVRAEFKSKKKKPQKGEDTHRPVIFKDSFDSVPLLVKSDENTLFHLNFKNSFKAMLDLECRQINQPTPFSDEIKAVAKPKYQKYIADDYWLSQSAKLTVWGRLVNSNQTCTDVSDSPNATEPSVIYNGRRDALFSVFRSKRLYSLLFYVWLLFVGVSFWSWMMLLPNILTYVLSGFVFGLVSALYVHFIERNPFRKPA
jgi:hypothetical protein